MINTWFPSFSCFWKTFLIRKIPASTVLESSWNFIFISSTKNRNEIKVIVQLSIKSLCDFYRCCWVMKFFRDKMWILSLSITLYQSCSKEWNYFISSFKESILQNTVFSRYDQKHFHCLYKIVFLNQSMDSLYVQTKWKSERY